MKNTILFFLFCFCITNLQGQSIQNTLIENLSYVLTGAGKKYSSNIVSDITQKLSTESVNANLDEYIDRTCKLIRSNNKLEKIDLPSSTGTFLKMKADWLNGKLQGLRTIHRNGVCYVNYEVQLLLLVTKFYFQQLQITYDVLLKLLGKNNQFSVRSTISDFFIESAVLVDATNLNMTLSRLVIPEGSTIKVQVTSESILGSITNAFLSTYTYLFQDSIRKEIENNMVDSVQQVFDNLPKYQRNEPVHVSPNC